ncbi:acetoacetate decarboxylase family protein [Streptomyces sp. TLI_105]|uniref:acetoacetate decarboxylase family protein n=1 Tax=Streptomyces sp. TLI_105 TaxID=1881019 RepID=UPI003523D797
MATATMACQWEPLDPAEARAQIGVPTYAVKIVPGRVCEPARIRTTDLTVKAAWTGPARLRLFEHVMAPLADLPVREIVSASHIVTDLTPSPMTSMHGHLADQGLSGR